MFVNLSWNAWIIFRLSFNIFFWWYVLSLYLNLQILLSTVFPRSYQYYLYCWWLASELSHPARGILNKYAPLFQTCYTVSLRNLLKDLLDCLARCMWSLFLTFANFCLWLAVFAVLRLSEDGRYGFKFSWKHQCLAFVFSLLVRLIRFCEMAKLSKSLLSNFNRMTSYQPCLH